MLSNLINRIKLPFRKDKELYLALHDIIGFYPHEIAYYKLALMHKSVGHRGPIDGKLADTSRHSKPDSKNKSKQQKSKEHAKAMNKKLNNERLEFLGDAILDAVVGDIVYCHFPGKAEGFLTNTRSKLVQRETLGRLAKEMGLSKLILSSGRSASHNSYMGGNAFEALVGAIYLDRGYDACMEFMQQRILGRYINIDKVAYKEVNFKSKLIEWAQKNKVTINYRLEDQSKDNDGSPTFKYTVVIETVDGATAEGFSKKESQQHASEETLRRLRNDSKFLDSVFEAKTQRTQMEEMPATVAPDTEVPKDDFIIVNEPSEASEEKVDAVIAEQVDDATSAIETLEASIDKEMELSDVGVEPKELSREDIIAAAEAAAYENSEKQD